MTPRIITAINHSANWMLQSFGWQSLACAVRWCCVAMLMLGNCLQAETPVELGLREEKNVVFREVDGERVLADLYRPYSDNLLPVVVMIHGGAWIAGDKWNVIDHAREMAQEGFVVMAINYRLAPKFRWPAQIDDCRHALVWLKKNADKWHADTRQVGLWGYSAGAQLSLIMGMEQATNVLPVAAIVAGGPPCDLTTITEDSRMLIGFLGGTRKQFPDRYRVASPINFVNKTAPPIFIFHGDDDFIVPQKGSREFLDRVKEAGTTIEYRSVPNKGHLWTFLDSQSRIEAIGFMKKYLSSTPKSN